MNSINFDTENLIIINYQGHGGGKFIANTLALCNQILHQNQSLAKTKISGGMSEQQSLQTALSLFNKQRNYNAHSGFGCSQLSGFTALQMEKNIHNPNKFWTWLTNQDFFYFIMVNHNNVNAFKKYKNAKHIICTNHEWIMQDRNYQKNLKWKKNYRSVDRKIVKVFNMESIKDQNEFKNEINQTLDKLDLCISNQSFIETMRVNFLQTYTLGYSNNQFNFIP